MLRLLGISYPCFWGRTTFLGGFSMRLRKIDPESQTQHSKRNVFGRRASYRNLPFSKVPSSI
jgi:hypothetical protein